MARRLLALILALAASATALVGCSSGTDRLTIYSGRTQNLIGPLLERFNQETGVPVEVRYGDSADLALLIEQEGERSPADVFLSQSPGALGFLGGDERLRELPSALLDQVDEPFESGQGLWVGLSGRVRVLVYNTEVVDEADLPASVFDLVDPRFQGQVAVAPANGSFQDFVTAMREVRGDDDTLAWLEAMVANDSPTYANNTAIVEAVARGEVPYGLVNHYYNERQLAEDPDSRSANYFFPDADLGSLILVTGAGVLDTSDRVGDAERLVRFLLGEEAQTFFSRETFEYPLAAGVQPPADLRPLEQIAAPRVDLNTLGGGLARTTELIDQSGLASS